MTLTTRRGRSSATASSATGRSSGDTIRGAWEWHRDGAWQHDFDLVYRRSVAP